MCAITYTSNFIIILHQLGRRVMCAQTDIRTYVRMHVYALRAPLYVKSAV